MKRGLLVVGIFVQRSFVKLDRLLMIPLFFRVEPAAVLFFGGTFVDRRYGHFAHNDIRSRASKSRSNLSEPTMTPRTVRSGPR
jgi:hypothetical protein